MVSLARGSAVFSSLYFVQRGFRASRISLGKSRFTPYPVPFNLLVFNITVPRPGSP